MRLLSIAALVALSSSPKCRRTVGSIPDAAHYSSYKQRDLRMDLMDYVYIALAVVACLFALPWVIGLVVFVVGGILTAFASMGAAIRKAFTGEPH